MKNQWTQKGTWPGGLIPAVAISPNFAADRLMLAATMAGIYRSTDGGRTWTSSSGGLTDLTTHILAFAPASDERDTPSFVFAATHYGRLYRSADGGLSWEELAAWAGLGTPLALAISPAYAVDGTLFVATGEGIFRSFDRGWSWQSANFGLLDLEVLCIACAPDFAATETVWAGTAEGGFYRSRNAGRSWRESGAGLADSAVQCLVVSPTFTEDRTLFVGTETDGVFRSTDAGASWSAPGPADQLTGQSINTLSILPALQSAQPDYPYALLAGTSSGIFLSADGGRRWTPAHQGPASPLTIAAGATGAVVAGDYEGGIYLSEDGGQTWQPSGAGLAAHIPPLAVMSPTGLLFAADSAAGIAYSQDYGETWQACNDGLASTDIQALALGGDQLFAATGTALYRAPAANPFWTPLTPPLEAEARLNLLALSPNFEQYPAVLLGTGTGLLYLSKDAGATWQEFPAPPGSTGQMLQAVLSADQRLNLMTATEIGPADYEVRLWQSESAAQDPAWEEAAAIQSVKLPAGALAIPPQSAGEIYFLALQNEFIKLVKDANGPLAVARHAVIGSDFNVTTLVVSSTYTSDQSLFAATSKGVFHSADDGATWQPLGRGLEERPVVALLLPPPGAAKQQLGAVTLGGAVWWLESWPEPSS